MKNRTPLYDDDALKRLSAQAARWLEGYPENDTSIECDATEYADLKRLAEDILTDETLERRLDSETLSTLRLIALIEDEAALSLDNIELPADLDDRLSAHIHSLAEAEEKEKAISPTQERRPRAWRFSYRWAAAAAIAALAVTGGYRLLNNVPEINDVHKTATATATADIASEPGKQGMAETTAKDPSVEISYGMEKSMSGKQLASASKLTGKDKPGKLRLAEESPAPAEGDANFPDGQEVIANAGEETADMNPELPPEIAGENLAMVNEICDMNLENTAEEVRLTLGIVAEQTAEITRAVNENLTAVGNIFRALQGNLVTTRESMERASASASSSSHMTPPTELRIRPNRVKSATAAPTEL